VDYRTQVWQLLKVRQVAVSTKGSSTQLLQKHNQINKTITMKQNHFTDHTPIRSKAIDSSCERLFCRTYNDKLRFAASINHGGHKIAQMVRVAGELSLIILN